MAGGNRPFIRMAGSQRLVASASVVRISGHGGVHALAAARRYGVSALFTLSGGHVFPLYDAAVKGGQPLRLVDVRHEQTAVFAAEATARLTRTPGLAAVTAGDLAAFFDAVAAGPGAGGARDPDWAPQLAEAVRAAHALDAPLMASDAEPVHPARIYAELLRVIGDDAVVIGDGGDFVSFAGKYIEPARPGGWLDPGPFGCLGTGLGYAIAARLARPSAQVVLLLGDGAAGFSQMDADTLVRHRLPVVIVCGNNGAWGLEKQAMRALYGYDALADLQPGCRYDDVVRALGGAGELVTRPAGIGPALRRAFAADAPYLVNVVTDPEIAYPRSTAGV
jgi:acetolactate synthase I/II/III large subunit